MNVIVGVAVEISKSNEERKIYFVFQFSRDCPFALKPSKRSVSSDVATGFSFPRNFPSKIPLKVGAKIIKVGPVTRLLTVD